MATTVTLKPNAIDISGSTSGTTTLQATAVAGTTTITLPAATDTLVGKATTDTLTNKTLTSPTITGGALNGTLGATTPSTVAATTISASGTTTLSGNQIISVTDNTNAALRITQLGTGNALLVEDSTNPDSTPFVIDASGIAVSGSTTAINYGGFTPNIQVNAAGSAQIGLSRFSANATSNAIAILKSRGTTVGDFTVLTSGDTLGRLEFYGADGTTGISGAQIAAAVDGTPGTSDMPGRLVFSTTADGASTPTERMRIDSSGNVGIGTASPTQKLQVAGNTFISAGQYFMWDNAGAWSLQSDASTYVRTFINGNEKLRVNAYGIGIGGAIPSSGTGITFPATQSASSDANTLDDYEEGTWTPSLGGTTTYSGRTATYTKVGDTVRAYFDITISTIGTGSLTTVSGFPFASTYNDAGAISYFNTLATSVIFLQLQMSTSSALVVGLTSAGSTNIANGINVFGNGTRLIGTVVYKTST